MTLDSASSPGVVELSSTGVVNPSVETVEKNADRRR